MNSRDHRILCESSNKNKKTAKFLSLRCVIQGTLVPKLTLGPFLTLSVRKGHKLKDWVFGMPTHIQSKSG